MYVYVRSRYSKTCVKRPLSKRYIFFKTDYRLMQVKSIAECSKGEHSAILSTFIKLPFVINTFVLTFVLSIFKWPFYTGFTVLMYLSAVYTDMYDLATIRYFFHEINIES